MKTRTAFPPETNCRILSSFLPVFIYTNDIQNQIKNNIQTIVNVLHQDVSKMHRLVEFDSILGIESDAKTVASVEENEANKKIGSHFLLFV